MKKINPTKEMLDDLSKMKDLNWCEKWGISRRMPIQFRKEYKIKPYMNQHGGRGHKIIDGVEMKWCPKDDGHFAPVSKFGKGNNRPDGLRGVCRHHEKLATYSDEAREKNALRASAWRKTDKGKMSLRNTWRKEKAKKDKALVKWDAEDELFAYNVFRGRCGYCGEKISILELEFDHFTPLHFLI